VKPMYRTLTMVGGVVHGVRILTSVRIVSAILRRPPAATRRVLKSHDRLRFSAATMVV
jgi:hypothetical protein